MRSTFEYHPAIGYRFIPGIKARVRTKEGGYLIKGNNLGFRCNRDATDSKPKGKGRVLVFGDSFTAGDGVRNEHRYTDLLETLVRDIEVFNFGLPGSGTDQQYLIFETFARDLEADLVILGVLVENIRRNVSRYRPYLDDSGETVLYAKPYYTLGYDGLKLHNQPVPRGPVAIEELAPEERPYVDLGGNAPMLRKLANKLGIKDILLRYSNYQPAPDYDDPNTPAWRLMKAILLDWITSMHCPVVLVPIPLYHFIEDLSDPSGYRARFAELAAESGAYLCDPLDEMRNHPEEERKDFRFRTDPHLSSAGHATLARVLAPVVANILGHEILVADER
jgi:hypothetical protein